MLKSLIPLCLPLVCHCLNAATVDVGSLSTSFAITVFPPKVTSVNVSNSNTVDLSPLAGLTPGNDIAITFATPETLIWNGGFGADTGDLTLLCHARLTLTAGGYSASSDETWSLGPVPWSEEMNPGDPVSGDPVGYMTGPVPRSITLTVPWGTDLSSVSLTLTDLFSIDGVNPYVTQSSLLLNQATLTTTTIPEPSTAFLSLFSAAALLCRRRI